MENGIESVPVNPEKMEREAKIVLHFLRHGQKGKGPDDYKVRLTPEGRAQAVESAEKVNLKQVMAFGSGRERAQETATLVMAGAEDEITGEETFEELKEKVNKGIGYGSKVLGDKRLDFTVDDKTPLGAEEMKAYFAGQYLEFVVQNSDKRAEELGDQTNSTYGRMAGGIAEIVEKYIKVADRWHELVNDEKKQYEEMMERFLGSHGGVTESFLLKVVEKTKGVAERDKLLTVIGNQFDFLEGFDVEVVKGAKDEKPSVRVKYEKKDTKGGEPYKFDEVVPIEVIEEIIEEGKE
jgi:broad specificity phosphatase PhoE